MNMHRHIFGGTLKLSKLLVSNNVKITSHRQIVHSIYRNTDIPNVPLQEYMWKNINKWHDKTALVCAKTNREYTYLKLQHLCNATSNFLYKIKNKNNIETIAIISPNIPEIPVVMLGAVQAGLKVAHINPAFSSKEMSKMLALCNAKLVFTLNVGCGAVSDAVSDLKIPLVVIKSKQNEETPANTINFDDVVKHGTCQDFKISHNMDDTILYFFSSGTTGLPKCVEITNKNVLSSLHNLSLPTTNLFDYAEDTYQDTTFGILPMFHVYGMISVVLNALTKGSKIVTIPKLETKVFKTALEKHPPTSLFVVPSLFHFVLNNPEVTSQDLSQLRAITSGAAPLSSNDIKKFVDKTKGRTRVLQLYGLTETTSMTHCCPTNLFTARTLDGIGMLVPSMEAKIVSHEGNANDDLGPYESGEMCLRGPQIMKGYYQNEKATREVLDEHGWLRTGDVGYYDSNGFFYLSSRIKELIKVKGFQVSPTELENLIKTHPEVDDVAVIGVPNEYSGEVIKAFVVPKANTKLKSDSIKEFVNKNVAPFKQLTGGVEFIESIPRSVTGKILRKSLN